VKFTKMQSAGNDYVLVEGSNIHRDWSSLAIAMCDRHFGIGADSLLALLPSDKAEFQMRIFDADGSEAEACGNGIRCLARYVYEKGLLSSSTDQILVETICGVREIRLYKEGNRLARIQANMGKPGFRADEIPAVISPDEREIVDIKSMIGYPVSVDGMEMLLYLVSMGNPHAIHFWQHPVSDFPLSRVGPKVENLGIFPNRVNFEVARVISPGQIEARVWERGVGETLACGSGACAITVAAQLLGLVDDKVNVMVTGGLLHVDWDGKGEVLLSGPAEIVFEGQWSE